MGLAWLDHVNIRTANLAPMSRFYADILELPKGPRPPFRFDGAWHYCGERPVVHLVEASAQPQGLQPRIEHFAFFALGLGTFLGRLKRHGVPYEIVLVPGNGNRQVNIADPDGNHIEVQFGADEAVDAADIAGRPR